MEDPRNKMAQAESMESIMKITMASSLDKLLHTLNERGKVITRERGGFNPSEWELIRHRDVRDFLEWKLLRKGAEDNPRLEDYNENVIIIHFESDIVHPLYRNVKDPIKFSGLLAKAFLENGLHLDLKTYKELRAQVDTFKSKEERIFERMYQAFHFWMGGSNYEKAVKWGQLLDKLTPYMPTDVKSSPKTTLFRLIAIDQAAFNKMRENKPLVLENRMYSSWTTSAKSAMNFAEGFNTEPNQVLVILKKTFNKKDVLVNIEQLHSFLLAKGKPVQQYSDAVDEKEIIIKNAHRDYQFTAKNISRYQDEDGKWVKM